MFATASRLSLSPLRRVPRRTQVLRRSQEDTRRLAAVDENGEL